jgi:hypothetical protein
MGLGGVALAWLMNRELLAEPAKPSLEEPIFDLRPKRPHQPPRATAMISLFMQGGPSHIDLCDPKPALEKWDGKEFPGTIQYDFPDQASRTVLASPWKFARHGQCGMEISELLPHLAGIVDEITLIRSMHTPVNNHIPSIRALQSGDSSGNNSTSFFRASLGSWITYALGSECDNLPAFVALTDTGDIPVAGTDHWTNGFLPSIYQGTVVRPQEPRILNLNPPPLLKGEVQDRALAFLNRMNRRHLAQRPDKDELQARIASLELAARMQLAAAEALDVSTESQETLRSYGLDNPATREYGSNCLLARRLVERGVRFVQVHTRSQYWDHHGRILTGLPEACKRTDQPVAALVKDLKQRGLLESTIVHWGGEMGRLPVIQNAGNRNAMGRDHNTFGFSTWLAGGGFKSGHIHGTTDEFGHKAVENPVSHLDYLATILHLLGLDHEHMVHHSVGRKYSLMDEKPCRVVQELLSQPAQV